MSDLEAQVSRDAQQRRKNLQEALELKRQVAEAQAARDGVQKEVGKLFVPLRGTRVLGQMGTKTRSKGTPMGAAGGSEWVRLKGSGGKGVGYNCNLIVSPDLF